MIVARRIAQGEIGDPALLVGDVAEKFGYVIGNSQISLGKKEGPSLMSNGPSLKGGNVQQTKIASASNHLVIRIQRVQ